MQNYTSLLSAKSIEKDSVKNTEGKDLGNIQELMIDTDNGKIEYAVLSFGGLMGMGDKYFAIPWGAISVDRENKNLILNVDKELLKDAPGFDKDNWPDMADATFRSSLTSYYSAYY
jgi:sporulation protein YlmC with PRC-barrel domain